MLVESSRCLGSLPKFSRILKRVLGTNQFYSTSPQEQVEEDKTNQRSPTTIHNLRFRYPEFLPPTKPEIRNLLREKLEREDMLRRRNVISIPEFYVGSVLAVVTSDKNAPKKTVRFVGICISRENSGLRSYFVLRNIVDNQGIEVRYHMYSPVIQSIEVLKLEKRLDEELYYLRDAPNEYSTFPFDMLPSFTNSKIVPVNTLKVPLNPRPWLRRYERMELKGVILPELSEKIMRQAELLAEPWRKYDLMDQYRETVPEEEQRDILDEISDELKKIEEQQKVEKKKKRKFVLPPKQTLF